MVIALLAFELFLFIILGNCGLGDCSASSTMSPQRGLNLLKLNDLRSATLPILIQLLYPFSRVLFCQSVSALRRNSRHFAKKSNSTFLFGKCCLKGDEISGFASLYPFRFQYCHICQYLRSKYRFQINFIPFTNALVH